MNFRLSTTSDTSRHILKRIFLDSAASLVCKSAGIPLAYLTPLAIARLYGSEQMGTYTIAANLVATIGVICRLGLDLGILRFTASYPPSQQPACLRSLLKPTLLLSWILSLIGGIFIYANGDFFVSRFHAPSLRAMLPVMAIALPVAVTLAVCSEATRALGGVRRVVFQLNILTPVTLLSLVLIFHYFDIIPIESRPKVLIWSFFFSILTALLYLIFTLWPSLHSTPSGATEERFPDLLRYSFPLFLSSLLTLGFAYCDTFIMGWVSTPNNVAHYVAAVKTATIVSIPLLIIDYVVTPVFSRLHRMGDPSALEDVARSTSRWMYYVALPLSFVTFIYSNDLLSAFGRDFPQASDSLRILLTAQLFNVTTGSVGFLLLMTGHQWAHITLKGSLGLFALPLMAFAAYSHGVTGLAFAKGAWLVLQNLLASILVWRLLHIKVFANQILSANLGFILGVFLYSCATFYCGRIYSIFFFFLGYLPLVYPTVRAQFRTIFQCS